MNVFKNLFSLILLLSRMTRSIKHSQRTVVTIIAAGIISGISNTVLIAVINTTLNQGASVRTTLVWTFVGLCLLLASARFISAALLVRLTQRAMFDLRIRLCRQILAAPLRLLEQLGSHRLLVTLVNDVPNITEALITLPLLFMNLAILLGCLVYMGWLSWSLLLGVLVFMILGIVSHQLPVIKATQHFGRAREEMDALFKHLRALTGGIKELKLHRHRREAFFSGILEPTAASMRRESIMGETIWAAAGSWGQILFFIFIGMVLFVVPAMKTTDTMTLTGYTLTILYMMGPLEFILGTLPRLGHADIAMKKIEALSISLAQDPTSNELMAQTDPSPSWKRLELDGITVSYTRDGEEADFILGPIDLSLRPGEFVFITGGNGSGKTTLAKLLTGLYVPETGDIRLDGVRITDENRDYYRQIFSAVYSDFHLFDGLIGLDEQHLDARARDYLIQLQLDHKVKVTNGMLSTIDLSQGQRKRLALLTAYLEERPVYVFDEWAADQDPQFKDVFYLALLPGLKAKGKTVIVISHDDRYYHVADRIIKLDYGRQESDETIHPATVAPTEMSVSLGS